MSYYRVCPRCGAHLDPGELCDCRQRPRAKSQTVVNLGKKTALDATNIQDGKKTPQSH